MFRSVTQHLFASRNCNRVVAILIELFWVADSANASWLSEAVREAQAARHPALEIAYWFSQLLLVTIAIIAAMAAYMQVTLIQRIELLKYIHNFEERAARRHVIRVLESKPYEEWDEVDDAYASTVAGTYEILARLLQSPGMRFGRQNKFFIQAFAVSIQRTFRILTPLIADRVASNGDGFLTGYQWLNEQARRAIAWPGIRSAQPASKKQPPQGCQLHLALPTDQARGQKSYTIVITVGSDRHVIDVTQGPPAGT